MTGPLPYIGGKHRIAKEIVAMFPDHTTYVEPFFGGGQVFFAKPPSAVEIINDLDGEIVNFFQICQRHHEELLRYLRWVLVGRHWFNLFEAQNPVTLTEIERAGRFFYLQKTAFAGLVSKRAFKYSVTAPPNLNLKRLPEIIEAAHRRLERTLIESSSYEKVLERYDRPGTTLFYLDPPYWNRSWYRFNFTDADFATLAERLHGIRGKFILSLNDAPQVREWFRDFTLRPIEFHYTSQRATGKRFKELLIMNFRDR